MDERIDATESPAAAAPAGGDGFALVYVTAAGVEEARRIGREAVRQRLAACANVYPQILSCYWWQGELVEDQEAVVILKTRRSLVTRVIEAVRAWHSYTVPAILVVDLRDGNPDYLAWLRAETEGAAGCGAGPHREETGETG